MASTEDPVGLALASIAAGATAGASVITAGLFVLRVVQGSIGGRGSAEFGEFAVLSVVVAAGLATSALTGFMSSRPIGEVWRRGVVGAIGSFGAILLTAATAPVDFAAGPVGLALYLALLIYGAVTFRRRVRGAQTP